MIIIGREGGQKIPINDKSVSRKHLEVTPLQDGSFKIKNIGTNGTINSKGDKSFGGENGPEIGTDGFGPSSQV